MSLTDSFDNPQSRVEAILQNAMGAEHEVVPQSRVEELLERLDGYLENIEGKITDQDEEIISAVNAWLEDNFSGDYSITDKTLSFEGMAADAKKTGDEFTQLKNTLNDKANTDGSYEQMTVGNAEQLVSTVFTDDSEPYNFRTAGGNADIGDRLYEKIVGGTVNWNQLVQNGNFADTTKWSVYYGATFSVSDNVATIVGDGDASGSRIFQDVARNANHKYLWLADIKTDGTVQAVIAFDNLSAIYASYVASTSWQTNATIVNSGSGSQANIRVHIRVEASKAGTIYAKNVNLIDLTLLFGSTIADYIYSLETANAGAGVAWFRKLFPQPYYAYDAGSLQSVQTSKHVTVGFNQWDEEWELGNRSGQTGELQTGDYINSKNMIHVFPATQYCIASPNNQGDTTRQFVIYQYDANGTFINFISVQNNPGVFTTNGKCRYIHFRNNIASTIYNHDICINLSWDGERDGEYEAYNKHEYPLADLTLRGIPKLDASNHLYYDGDTYESDGTVTRKYGIVDLGTLSWKARTMSNNSGFWVENGIPGVAVSGFTSKGNAICSKYPIVQNGNVGVSGHDKEMAVGAYWASGCNIYVVDSAYSDAPSFTTAMSGVYLVYELAEPTTESAAPFQSPQVVDDFGTEEYIDAGVTASTPTRDVSIPVGHYSEYPENQVAKLDGLPKDFSTLIAPTEKTFTATRNYTSGALLIVNNVLYKATSNIANGGTITPNTNVTATTLAEIISALA